jgi:hypothetical protein
MASVDVTDAGDASSMRIAPSPETMFALVPLSVTDEGSRACETTFAVILAVDVGLVW